jgi:hypothetical protein
MGKMKAAGWAALLLSCTTAKVAEAPVPPAPAAPSEPSPAPEPASALGSGLRFKVDPPDAEVFVDGQSRGRVAELPGERGILQLSPGLYQVSLKKPGYQTWRAEVAVKKDAPEPIEVTLVRTAK